MRCNVALEVPTVQGKGRRALHPAKLTMCGDPGGHVIADDGWKLPFLRSGMVGIQRSRGEATGSTSGVAADSLQQEDFWLLQVHVVLLLFPKKKKRKEKQ